MAPTISWWALDARCYLLVGSGCLLLLAGGLWNGCCCVLVGSRWLLIFPDGLWMLAVVSWWAVEGSRHFMGHGTTILGLFRTLLITTFCLVHHTTCLSGQYSPATRTRKNPGSRAAKISPRGKFRHFLNGEIFPAKFSPPESPPPPVKGSGSQFDLKNGIWFLCWPAGIGDPFQPQNGPF